MVFFGFIVGSALVGFLAYRLSKRAKEEFPVGTGVGIGITILLFCQFMLGTAGYYAILDNSSRDTGTSEILPFEDGSYVHIQYSQGGQYITYNRDVDGKPVPESFVVDADDKSSSDEFLLVVRENEKPSLERIQEISDDGYWYPWPLLGEVSYEVRVPQDAIVLIK